MNAASSGASPPESTADRKLRARPVLFVIDDDVGVVRALPGALRPPQRPGRVRQARQRAIEFLDASAYVVPQELAGGRDRRRRPRHCGRRGRIGGQVEQRHEGGNSSHPVGHSVVHPQEYPDPPAGQARQEPRLPARPRPVQAAKENLVKACPGDPRSRSPNGGYTGPASA
jgi:hypothetical protein